MRESTSSREPLDSSSDHDRSFERTRGSYIACINRSLEHAFEFLSETGYASGGLSDAERIESRCSDDTEHVKGQNVYCDNDVKINSRQLGSTDIKPSICDEVITEYIPGRLWGISEKAIHKQNRTEYHNNRNKMLKTASEEKLSPAKGEKKIILYQHVNGQNPRTRRRHVSKSMENIGPKRGPKESEIDVLRRFEGRRNSAGAGKQQESVRPCQNNKENSVPGKKLHEREDSGYESKAESRNGMLNNRVRNDSRRGRYHSQIFESDRRESTPYLTTEREILKQILTNAKESEQLQQKHRRSSKSLSNLDLRRAASKISLGPTQRQRTPVKSPASEQKGFKKFRESFRKTTSYFMPHKFTVQEEKGAGNDFANALEFQYHCMHQSRDGNEPITSSINLTGKKKGFFRSIFERKKQKQPNSKQRMRSFRSSESINQSRWHSRENLSKKTERPKSISMLIDKVKEPVDESTTDLRDIKNNGEELRVTRRSSVGHGSRFRRSESLRSIPSTSQYADHRYTEIAGEDPVRTRRTSRNRPMSVHGMILRTCSYGSNDNKTEAEEVEDLHRVLKNRLSCCSINENIFQNGLNQNGSLDFTGNREPIFTSSSPRKNDDITEWIRGLQFSSSTSNFRKFDNFEVHKTDRIVEEQERDDDCSLDDHRPFFHETRIVNGQIQTYL